MSGPRQAENSDVGGAAMNFRENYRTVVVGGGPAGALLSFLLAKFGVDVLLIERQNDFAREFRGEGLSPSGQAMFKEAGLWEAFDSVPHTVFTNVKLFFKGKLITSNSLNFSDLDYQPRFVSQPAMLEMLVAEASKFQSFSFMRGERVLGPIIENGRVVGVDVREGEDCRHIQADYVFAADGRFSVLRKAAGLEVPRSPQFFDVVWCKIPMPAFAQSEPKTVRGYFGNGHLGLFIPSHDGLLQVGWVIKKGSFKDFREKGTDGWLAEMAEHVDPDMAAHLRAHINDAVHPFLLDVVCDHYPKWSVPGMTLLGDAAHPMSPVGAQGINIALRDAVVAANHFVPVFLSGAEGVPLDDVANAFAAERRKEVLQIQNLQARPPAFLLAQGMWLDVLIAVAKGLLKLGVFDLFSRFSNPQTNPMVSGTTKIKLKL